MKKLLTILLSVLMLCTLTTINVFAEGEEEATPDAKQTELIYTVDSSYEWTVPSNPVSFNSAGTTNFDVEVIKCVVADDEILNITVNSRNDFYVISGRNKIAYNIWKKSNFTGNVFSAQTAIKDDDVILETREPVKQSMFAKIIEEAKRAGTYTDILTFTASIKSAPVEEVSGLYKTGVQVKTWDELKNEFSDAFKNNGKMIAGNNDVPISYFKDLEDEFVIDSSVTSLGKNAFCGCEKLTSFTIPNTVTAIGPSAFSGCTALSTIKFTGTKEQWNNINPGSDWNKNVPATTVKCSDGDISLVAE